MKNRNTRRGFTLIELLVVVLIIGILAAVAVPQYNKAVMKSRIAEYEVNMKAIRDAQQVCYLRKGSTCTWDELDISQPECKPIPGIIDSCYYVATGVIYRADTERPIFVYHSLSEKIPTSAHTGIKYTADTQMTCYASFLSKEKCQKLGFIYAVGNYVFKEPPSQEEYTY